MPCRKRFSARNSEGLDKAIQEELLDQKLIMFFFRTRCSCQALRKFDSNLWYLKNPKFGHFVESVISV